MACRGVHFALTDEDAKRVLAAAGDNEALIELIQEDIESRWDTDWLAETDKAWDAIHRCLTDGRLSFASSTPRHLCILGGRQLYDGDDYIVSFITPEQVKEVARAIADIDEAWMRARYFAIPASDYGCPLTDDDCGYTWSLFQGVQALYQKAAAAGRAVMFTVDQ
jgi:hypothetical protein